MGVKPIPDGFHTVTPYLVCEKSTELIGFLKAAFDAVEISRVTDSDGRVMNAEIKIGNSMMMLADSRENFLPTPSSFYLYVLDTDSVYQKALKAGATSILEPADQFYGDRNAGVQDNLGNKWWIATHIEDVSLEEVEKRAKERSK